MHTVPFAVYNAFSETCFGGSPAAIVSNAKGIDTESRQRIAIEIGAPATSFVEAGNPHIIHHRSLLYALIYTIRECA